MNAPLRKDAVTGSLAQPRVTFRVRQRTEQMFDVLREMSGPDVQSVEEEFTSDPIRSAARKRRTTTPSMPQRASASGIRPSRSRCRPFRPSGAGRAKPTPISRPSVTRRPA